MTTLKPTPVHVVVISPDPAFAQNIGAALAHLARAAGVPYEGPAAAEVAASSPLFLDVAARARPLFAAAGVPLALALVPRAGAADGVPAGLCFIDDAALTARDVPAQLREARALAAGLAPVLLLGRAPVYHPPAPDGWRLGAEGYAALAVLDTAEALAEVVATRLCDHVQQRFVHASGAAAARPPVALGACLHRFMAEHAFDQWAFFYLTGSPVSALINDLETLARRDGVPCLRGPTEHSLAVGAFANWRVNRQPFVITVTKGMMDEFRGTLSNLQQARARGFIIAADDGPETWFGAQASINRDEDIRDVLSARRLPQVMLRSPETFAADMTRAFALYARDEGPVVILATAQMLAYRTSAADLATVDVFAADPPRARAAPLDDRQVDEVAQLLNEEPVHVLWQVGSPLDARERSLVLDIAGRAGIALANSCISPGAVPHLQAGGRTRNLIGSAGVYTFDRAYHDFLFTGGRPNRDQVVFFLKSRLSGAERPLSDASLAAEFRVFQVDHDPQHIAPFVARGLVTPLLTLLERLAPRVQPRPAILALREAKLAGVLADRRPDLVEAQATLPMTANHFTTRLGALLTRLVQGGGYDFLGVNGVSRVGFSMVRNVPLTRPGFSGIYGRGLMGDAWLAVNTLAFTAGTNVVAVIGDGERNMVPDILPSLLENALHGTRPLAHNVTVFVGCNNSYSMIETYLALSGAARGTRNRQATNLNLLPPDLDREVAGIRVCQRLLHTFDDAFLAEALTAHPRINVFPILLSHNDAGDGMTLASMRDWRYLPPA